MRGPEFSPRARTPPAFRLREEFPKASPEVYGNEALQGCRLPRLEPRCFTLLRPSVTPLGHTADMPVNRTSVEICAGAGGQAIGLEWAGFSHLACVEIDTSSCMTLRHNRPGWKVIECDVTSWDASEVHGQVDLLSGGVPCPPFSIAGKQLGPADERDLFPTMLRLAAELLPRAVMVENVRGLLASKFDRYRESIVHQLAQLGYVGEWRLLNSADFGVPQARLRTVLVAMNPADFMHFEWPEPTARQVSVGEALLASMSVNGWTGAQEWALRAKGVAPALVGGSKKHGGADLGPTRARAAWRLLGVDGGGVADQAPGPDFSGDPRLTVQQAALVQGFPANWTFLGRKTAAYRQVGNAFPPPVARAVGEAIGAAMDLADAGIDRRAG